MDARKFCAEPERDDEKKARRWRGPLFEDMHIGLSWWDKWHGFYDNIEQPPSVTFPICNCCGHVVWDDPHFEETVPKNSVCEQCFNELEEQNKINGGDH